jgi:hypothetical protein
LDFKFYVFYWQVASHGYTILDRAVMEHNLIAISRIYDNINITELGTTLGLDADKAEKVRLKKMPYITITIYLYTSM